MLLSTFAADCDVKLMAEKRLRRKSETNPRCSFYERDVTSRDIYFVLFKLLNVAKFKCAKRAHAMWL